MLKTCVQSVVLCVLSVVALSFGPEMSKEVCLPLAMFIKPLVQGKTVSMTYGQISVDFQRRFLIAQPLQSAHPIHKVGLANHDHLMFSKRTRQTQDQHRSSSVNFECRTDRNSTISIPDRGQSVAGIAFVHVPSAPACRPLCTKSVVEAEFRILHERMLLRWKDLS